MSKTAAPLSANWREIDAPRGLSRYRHRERDVTVEIAKTVLADDRPMDGSQNASPAYRVRVSGPGQDVSLAAGNLGSERAARERALEYMRSNPDGDAPRVAFDEFGAKTSVAWRDGR